MSLTVATLGTLDGVEVRSCPVAGVFHDRGALVRVQDGRVAWSLALSAPPLLAAHGRRLYAAVGDTLACIDLRTGAPVWSNEVGAIRALDAHPDGVDTCVDTSVVSYDVYGGPMAPAPLRHAPRHIRRVGPFRYAATDDTLWKLAPGAAPTQLLATRTLALHDRDGALQALADGIAGTVLVEDDGVPLVWPFPAADRHWLAPWGRAEWAVVPREGRGGVWVVDRRVQTRWHVPLPGRALGVAVAGRAVAVLLDDGGPVLALTHPDVSAPLLLALDAPATLHGDGETLYLTHEGHTAVYLVREA